MRTADIVKMIKADIDRGESDIKSLRTKLQYSYTLLERIERRKDNDESDAVPEIRKEAF